VAPRALPGLGAAGARLRGRGRRAHRRGVSAALAAATGGPRMPPGEVRSVYAVSRADLLDFYDKMDPERSCPPSGTWDWLYRPGFDARCRALVVERDHRVVAHAGIIPFWLALRDRTDSPHSISSSPIRPRLHAT